AGRTAMSPLTRFIPLSGLLILSLEPRVDRRLWHSKFSTRLFPQARMRNHRTMLLEWLRVRAMAGSRLQDPVSHLKVHHDGVPQAALSRPIAIDAWRDRCDAAETRSWRGQLQGMRPASRQKGAAHRRR